MTGNQLIRRTLWTTAVFNIAGALLFAFPSSSLGQFAGLPADVPPLYRSLLAILVLGFGGAYVWLALQPSINRPFIAFVAINKFCVFAAVFVLWLVGETAFRCVVLIGSDLLFAALFAYWLMDAQQAVSRSATEPAR